MGDEGGENPFAGALKKKKAPPADGEQSSTKGEAAAEAVKDAADAVKDAAENPFGGALKKKKSQAQPPPAAADDAPADNPFGSALKKKKAPPGDEDKPSVTGSAAGSEANPFGSALKKKGAAPSKLGNATDANLSRKVSGVTGAGGDAAPKSPAEAPPLEGSRRGSQNVAFPAGGDASASQMAPLSGSRTGSRASLTASQREAGAAAAAAEGGSQALGGSRRPSQSQISRHGSQLEGSRRGSQAGVSAQGSQRLSRQGSAVAGDDDARQQTVALGSVLAAPVEDGEDKQATIDALRQQVSELTDLIAAKDKEIKELNSEVADLKKGDKGGGGKGDKKLQKEFDEFKKKAKQREEEDRDTIRELEAQIRRRGSQAEKLTEQCASLERKATAATLEKVVREQSKAEVRQLTRQNSGLEETVNELRSKVKRLERELQEAKDAAAHQRPESHPAAQAGPTPEMIAQMEQMKAAVQARNQELHAKAAELQQMNTKLLAAQDAIVAGTEYGWEKDIKLAQARRALMSIVEHGSPQRAAAGGGGASPKQDVREAEEAARQAAALQEQLADAQARKAQAVENEDYVTAQQLLGEINDLKAKVEGAKSGKVGMANLAPAEAPVINPAAAVCTSPVGLQTPWGTAGAQYAAVLAAAGQRAYIPTPEPPVPGIAVRPYISPSRLHPTGVLSSPPVSAGPGADGVFR